MKRKERDFFRSHPLLAASPSPPLLSLAASTNTPALASVRRPRLAHYAPWTAIAGGADGREERERRSAADRLNVCVSQPSLPQCLSFSRRSFFAAVRRDRAV